MENPRQNPAIDAKIRATNLARYGTEYAIASDRVRQKSLQAFQDRFGADNPMKDAGVRERARQTSLERYGTEYPMQCQEIRQKARETSMRRFGVPYAMQSPVVQKQVKQLFLERYGVDNPMKHPSVRELARQTCLERYGVENPSQNLDVYQKIWNTKLEHQTYLSGDSEEVLYEQLVAVFGADDVKRQYVSDVYPYPCDFYIVSRDLRIELNASWVHGGHWYDDTKDRAVLTEWIGKSADSLYYHNAIVIWTERDVEKRACAKMNGLKYLVFWDTKLQDAQLWFDCGCPDATDWEREYSWLLKRTLSEHL